MQTLEKNLESDQNACLGKKLLQCERFEWVARWGALHDQNQKKEKVEDGNKSERACGLCSI